MNGQTGMGSLVFLTWTAGVFLAGVWIGAHIAVTTLVGR